MKTFSNSLFIARLLVIYATAFCAVILITPAIAHEIRPAYLQIEQITSNRYEVVWRTPLLSGSRLPVALRFPHDVRNVTGPGERQVADSLVERRVVEASDGLAGKRIEIVGLQATITDALVRIKFINGATSSTLVHPSQPWVDIKAAAGVAQVATTFIMQGIEHILFGYDHLVFVLALVLLAGNWPSLLLTVTSFTLAHSITLTLATFGVVNVAAPPVEAAIALSILLLAAEINRIRSGGTSLTAERPWLVAFAFGLLHGLGFAGALAQLALPSADIPLALLFFNIGVEIGQLLFIAVILIMVSAIRVLRYPPVVGRWAFTATTYAIGITASIWFIERVASFMA